MQVEESVDSPHDIKSHILFESTRLDQMIILNSHCRFAMIELTGVTKFALWTYD